MINSGLMIAGALLCLLFTLPFCKTLRGEGKKKIVVSKKRSKYKKHRSSKEQSNMALPSLDRLSYIHCLLREFLPGRNYIKQL